MATRFYLPSTGAADVSPTFDASWDKTSQADRLKCVTTPIGSAMVNASRAPQGVNPSNTLCRQYVSDPILMQTITGTVKGQIRMNENAGMDNLMPQLLLKVVSNDGTVFRGTLFGHINSALSNEATIAMVNRKFPRNWSGWSTAGAPLTDVVASENDRIVIEIGCRQESTGTGNYQTRFGDSSDTDMAENDESNQADNNPWIEFSINLFAAPPAVKVVRHNSASGDLLLTGYPDSLRSTNSAALIADGVYYLNDARVIQHCFENSLTSPEGITSQPTPPNWMGQGPGGL